MSKLESYSDYPADGTAMAKQVLLTAWDSMAAFQEDLVLVGGLAVRYLTNPPNGDVKGPVTLDVERHKGSSAKH